MNNKSSQGSASNSSNFREKLECSLLAVTVATDNYIEQPPRSYYWGPAMPLIVSYWDLKHIPIILHPRSKNLIGKCCLRQFCHLIFGSFFTSRQKLQFKWLGPDISSWSRISFHISYTIRISYTIHTRQQIISGTSKLLLFSRLYAVWKRHSPYPKSTWL